MASTTPVHEEMDYPTGDGQPMAETPVHRKNLTDTIAALEARFASEPSVYISGNMFVYYARGQRNRCLAPDVFVVYGVPRGERDVYKTWEETKPTLDLVVEFTSRSTREEDLEDKFGLYRDELGVREYLLFDPYEEYLDPPQQLYRLVNGDYVPVEPVDGRLPSEVTGLHFERSGRYLRLFDPAQGAWLKTPEEIAQERQLIARERDRLAAERDNLTRQLRTTATALQDALRLVEQAVAERDREVARTAEHQARLGSIESGMEQLRREMDEMKRHGGSQP